MGWPGRDYARWTDEERRRFLGAGGPRRSTASATRRLRDGASAAILVSAAILALGHLPKGHPLVPSLRFSLPHSSRHVSGLGKIAVPRHGLLGSSLTLSGTFSGADGRVVRVEETYGGGWRVVRRAEIRDGRYATTVRLERRGLLHLRLVYPDGSRAVGSIRVR
jgi:hypothetical protein